MHNCSSCMDTKPAVTAPCNHHYCRECTIRLFEGALPNESLFSVRCCRQPIPISVVQHYLGPATTRQIERKTIQPLLPEILSEQRGLESHGFWGRPEPYGEHSPKSCFIERLLDGSGPTGPRQQVLPFYPACLASPSSRLYDTGDPLSALESRDGHHLSLEVFEPDPWPKRNRENDMPLVQTYRRVSSEQGQRGSTDYSADTAHEVTRVRG